QTVPAERSDKPRQASGRQKHLVIRAKDRQSKRRHVFKRLSIETIKFLVATTNFQHCPQPVRECLSVLPMMLVGAFLRRSMDSLVVLQGVEQAAVPGLSGIQYDLEVEATIGISCFGPTVRRSDYCRANEIAIAVTGPQLLPRLRPCRGDVPAAYD